MDINLFFDKYEEESLLLSSFYLNLCRFKINKNGVFDNASPILLALPSTHCFKL